MRRIVVVLGLVLAPSVAQAYPQFQLSTGATRCNACHYAPAGGGLLNGFGRGEVGDTISMWGGDGALLHGLVKPPDWLAAGAEIRLAGAVNDNDAAAGTEVAAFPMQMDLLVRFQLGAFSLYANGGIRGLGREAVPHGADDTTNPQQTGSSRFISREHYLMWRPQPQGWYARAGRFFAPYGLRLVEHPTYVRRWLNFDTLQETYNLSGGFVSDEWELHLTAFTPDFFREAPGPDGSGGAVYYERRLGKTATVGAQARVIVGDVDVRGGGGLVGKLYLPGPHLQLQAQLDVVYQSFDDFDGRTQLVGYLGGTWFAAKGLMATLFLERFDEDLSLGQTARSAVGAELQWFPYAHFEVSLWGRIAMIGTGTDDGPLSEMVLLQLHYFL